MAKRSDMTNGDDQPATRGVLREQLALVVDLLVDRMDRLRVELRTELTASEQRLAAQLKSWFLAAEERSAANMAVIDEKYKDLPPRVTRLEAKVFAPRRGRGRS